MALGNVAAIEGIGTDFGGQVTQRRFTITSKGVTPIGAVLTGDVLLFNLPAGGKILGVTIKASTAFVGTTTLTVSVGTGASGTVDAFASAFDIKAAVSDTNFQDSGQYKSLHFSGDAVYAHFIATVANLDQLTTGTVDIFVTFLNVTTPLP